MRKQAINLTKNLGFAHGMVRVVSHLSRQHQGQGPSWHFEQVSNSKPHSQGPFVHPVNTTVINLVLKGDKLTSDIFFIEVTRRLMIAN